MTPATFDVLLHRAIAALKKGLGAGEASAPPSPTKSPKTRTKTPEVGDDDA